MTEPVKFGPITAAIIHHLETSVGVPCSLSVPATRPAAWVRVLRTGGPQVDLITEDAQITLEAWADTPVAAEDLAYDVRHALQRMRRSNLDGIAVYRVAELAGPAYLPDPESHQPRWTFTVSVRARGVAPLTP